MIVLPAHGVEWIVDASRCSDAALQDQTLLHGIFRAVVSDLDLHPIGRPTWHRFPITRGLTGLWMLKESHLACHTFPEFEGACFNLFCCKVRPAWDWALHLNERLGAAHVQVRSLRRTYGPPAIAHVRKVGT